MPVFALLPDTPTAEALKDKIAAAIPQGDFIALPGGHWLISHVGTSRDVSEALGINADETAVAVILAVNSYWGRATNDVWEWLGAKLK